MVANGGGVYKKKCKLTYNRIAGYGRPDYGMSTVASDPNELKKGDKNDAVALLQENFISLGYNLGTYGTNKNGVDGEFGSKTQTALKITYNTYIHLFGDALEEMQSVVD